MEEIQGASTFSLSAQQREEENKKLKSFIAYSLIGSVALHLGVLSLRIGKIWDTASEQNQEPIELVVLDAPEQQVASSKKIEQAVTAKSVESPKPVPSKMPEAVIAKPVESPKPVPSQTPEAVVAKQKNSLNPISSPSPVVTPTNLSALKEKPARISQSLPGLQQGAERRRSPTSGGGESTNSPAPLGNGGGSGTSPSPSNSSSSGTSPSLSNSSSSGTSPSLSNSSSSGTSPSPGNSSSSGTSPSPGNSSSSGTSTGSQPGRGSPTGVATASTNSGTTREPAKGRGSRSGRLTCRQLEDPEYPERARREGWEGRVKIKIEVDKNGNVVDAQPQKSSGHTELDQAAITQAKACKFDSAEGEWQGIISVNFKLKD